MPIDDLKNPDYRKGRRSGELGKRMKRELEKSRRLKREAKQQERRRKRNGRPA